MLPLFSEGSRFTINPIDFREKNMRFCNILFTKYLEYVAGVIVKRDVAFRPIKVSKVCRTIESRLLRPNLQSSRFVVTPKSKVKRSLVALLGPVS